MIICIQRHKLLSESVPMGCQLAVCLLGVKDHRHHVSVSLKLCCHRLIFYLNYHSTYVCLKSWAYKSFFTLCNR